MTLSVSVLVSITIPARVLLVVNLTPSTALMKFFSSGLTPMLYAFVVRSRGTHHTAQCDYTHTNLVYINQKTQYTVKFYGVHGFCCEIRS